MTRIGHGTYRVILADDDGAFRRSLRLLLEASEEFQVVGEAATAAEALNLIAISTPDLVIADLDMPNGGGLNLTAQVQEEFPGIRVILISGHTERQYRRLAREAGALAFIPKASLSLEALRHSLQEGG